MKASGNGLMYGLGGLALATMFIEGKAKQEARALAQQLQESHRALQFSRAETARERELRMMAERAREEQRRLANEQANLVAARESELQKVKAELAKVRAELVKATTKEEKNA